MPADDAAADALDLPWKRSWPAWTMLGVGLVASACASLQLRQAIEEDAVREFAFGCDQITLRIRERLDGQQVQAASALDAVAQRQGAVPGPSAERPAALPGGADAAYRLGDFMHGLVGDWVTRQGIAIDLHIYAAREPSHAGLLFESQPATPILHSPFYQQRMIDFNGSQWLLAFDSPQGASGIGYREAWSALIAGLALSGVLCALMLSLIRTQAAAARIAGGLTAEIQRSGEAVHESAAFTRAILDALPAEIAVIDGDGVIIAVNDAWRRFSLDNASEPGQLAPHTEIGANYLAACQAAAGATADEQAARASAGIRAVLAGSLPCFSLEYPCHSTVQRRWFAMSVAPVHQKARAGAVITHTDITARKQAEEAGAEALERLQKIAARVPGLTYQYRLRADGSSCFPFASAAMRAIFRVSPDDVRDDASAVFATVHPDDLAGVTASIRQSAEDLTPWDHEYRVQFADGTVRWQFGNALPEPEADGAVLWHGFIADVTDRRERDAQLGASRSLLRTVVSAIPDLIWLKNGDGVYLACNRRFEHFFGAAEKDIVGRTDYDFVDLELADSFREHDRMAASQGEAVVNEEWVTFAADGHRELLETTKVVVFDDQQRPLGVLGIGHDVTVLRQTEARLASLVAEQRAILHSEVVGFVMLREGAMIWLNQSFARMLGYEVDELIAQRTGIFDQDNRVYRASHEAAYASMTAGRVFRTQAQFLRQDGSLGWFDISGANLRIECKESIWAFVDISAQKHVEAELSIARSLAEQASSAKSRFLTTMSHEIRTPMNGILGMAQILLLPNADQGERQDAARTIYSCGQTLLTLLNDILDLAKVEAGKVTLEAVVLEPGSIVDEVRALFSEAAGGKALRLDAAWCGPAGQRYLGDPCRLGQMLANLVGNAIKFTGQGHVSIEACEIARDETTAVLEFAVADSGIGVAADQHGLLFEPFAQATASTTRQYGGTGLGLSIVRTLAALMGGDVGLQSEAGQGSRFWFRIRVPLVAASEAADRAGRPVGAGGVAITGRFSGRVLVVEDNATNRKVVKGLLSKLGVTVALAEDGQQALDAIMRGDAADLILMDLQMPVMDGDVATERIRQWEAAAGRPRCPIVALTADAFDDSRRHCLAVGMDDFLAKPIVFAALKSVLGRWLSAVDEGLPETAPPVVRQPVDIQRVLALVDEITPLLIDNRFDAVARFRELSGLLAGRAVATEIDEIGRVLTTCRFDLALERLRRLLASEGWEDLA